MGSYVQENVMKERGYGACLDQPVECIARALRALHVAHVVTSIKLAIENSGGVGRGRRRREWEGRGLASEQSVRVALEQDGNQAA